MFIIMIMIIRFSRKNNLQKHPNIINAIILKNKMDISIKFKYKVFFHRLFLISIMNLKSIELVYLLIKNILIKQKKN